MMGIPILIIFYRVYIETAPGKSYRPMANLTIEFMLTCL